MEKGIWAGVGAGVVLVLGVGERLTSGLVEVKE